MLEGNSQINKHSLIKKKNLFPLRLLFLYLASIIISYTLVPISYCSIKVEMNGFSDIQANKKKIFFRFSKKLKIKNPPLENLNKLKMK